MRHWFFGLFILVLLLAACGGGNPAAPVTEAEVANVPLDLAPEVDVHTVATVKERDDVYLLDVREQWEYDEGHIPGVTLLPMGEVPSRLDERSLPAPAVVAATTCIRPGPQPDLSPFTAPP